MTASNNLEIKGALFNHPFAELVLEISEAQLTGSLRLGFENEKVIVYFVDGVPVFAVSNARRHRLFEILLHENILTQNQLTAIPEFTNDFALSEYLKNNQLFSGTETNLFFTRQFEDILKSIFEREAGDWIFSPQARIKENIRFNAKIGEFLLHYGRTLPDAEISSRFKSLSENFRAKNKAPVDAVLLPTEGFVLSRFENSHLPLNEIIQLCGLPEAVVLRIIYTLWLGGFLSRQDRQAAFSEQNISDILSARLTLKKTVPSAEKPITVAPQTPAAVPVEQKKEVKNEKTAEMSLDKYLREVENATNLYEVLGLPIGSDFQEIKRRYFSYAKQFHPDMFHKEKDAELVQKIQNAFALTAQAYDTLKNDETRQVYDYKLEKSISSEKADEKLEPTIGNAQQSQNMGNAVDSFEKGYSLLMEDGFEQAIPFLARAVQLEPNNAKYHAYYGKALSSDKTQRYKADLELQTAIRFDLNNVTYRIMSAEFYIQFGLIKRAEGELKRLLNISPNNAEALKLLKSLPKK